MRRDDWRSRLHEAVEQTRREPFAWGQRDCALFAADCVLAMTDRDMGEPFRGRYDDAPGALTVLSEAGLSDLASLAGSMLDEIPPMMARDGDVAAIPAEHFGYALGIVSGERVLVRMPDGIGSVDRSEAVKAFRVP